MLQLLIIKQLLFLENYAKFRHHVKLKKDDKELSVLYSLLDTLMETYNRDITLEEYKLFVLTKYPEYDNLLIQLEGTGIAEELLKDQIAALIERSLAHDLAIDAINLSEGKGTVEKVLDYLDKFKEKEKIDQAEFVTDDLEALWEDTVHKPGLRWRLKTLNLMLGSLRKGDFGFVFARPETGKTTFLASEVTFMASQLKDEDGPILWFNNEEGGKKVKVRMYQGALGCDLPKLYADRKASHAAYMKRTKGKIYLYDNAATNKRQIERMCKELNPSLIIFDQIDKIKGFDNDREDLRLGGIYIWARELAKTYCPVIGVCQADVTGENKRWLTMDNVANAKTSKQAEADWILGIGAVHDEGLESIRYFHASKNKLSGDEDSDNALRHGKREVKIRPDISRYEDLI